MKRGVLFVLLVQLISGCGAHSNAPLNPTQISKKVVPGKTLHLGKSFGIQVSTGDNPTQGARSLNSDLNEATREGDTLVFHRKFFLKDPDSKNEARHGKTFLVWPEKSFESMITSATFSHRVLKPDGSWIGDLRLKPLWYDSESHIWFIPIEELFTDFKEYPTDNVQASDTQVLQLELVLQKNQKVQFEIRFQAEGPIPSNGLEPVDLDDPGLMGVPWGKTVSAIGWVVKKEKWSNPSTRPFTLWIRKTDNDSGSLQSYIRTSTCRQNPNSAPEGPFHSFGISTAEFRVSSLMIRHSDGRIEEADLAPDQWAQVEIQPAESVLLEWRALPVSGTPRCSIAATDVVYRWEIPAKKLYQNHLIHGLHSKETMESLLRSHPMQGITNEVIVRPAEPRAQPCRVGTDLVGARLEAKWNREIRIAHPFVVAEDAKLSFQGAQKQEMPDLKVIETPEENFSASVGDVRPGIGPFSCQGTVH